METIATIKMRIRVLMYTINTLKMVRLIFGRTIIMQMSIQIIILLLVSRTVRVRRLERMSRMIMDKTSNFLIFLIRIRIRQVETIMLSLRSRWLSLGNSRKKLRRKNQMLNNHLLRNKLLPHNQPQPNQRKTMKNREKVKNQVKLIGLLTSQTTRKRTTKRVLVHPTEMNLNNSKNSKSFNENKNRKEILSN